MVYRLLQLSRREISETRMKSLLIIHLFNEDGQILFFICKRVIFLQVHFFLFERLEEAFRLCIIVRISSC